MWWALIRKELREIAPFASAGAVYCLFVILTLHSSTRDLLSPLSVFGLLGNHVLIERGGISVPPFPPTYQGPLQEFLIIFSFPLLICFGVRQTLGEDLKRTFPFLIHRPVSRNSIFLIKILTGLAVYLFLILSVIFTLAFDAAAPGHYAYPFSWGMVLNYLLIPAGGIVFYLAVFLVGLRRERWYGTRLLPVIAFYWIIPYLFSPNDISQSIWFLHLFGVSLAGLWVLLAILDQIWTREY